MKTSPIAGGTSEYGSVGATFADGFQPEVHTVALEDGACRLLTYQAALCDPLCTDGVCTGENQCQAYATPLSAGTLTVSGLRQPVVLTESEFKNYYLGLEYDAFEPEATIEVAASGADMPAFSLSATAPSIPDLIVSDSDGNNFPDFTAGAGYTFRWRSIDPDSRVHLAMAADNGHGNPSPAIVECDAPDTGSLEVPAAILDGFIDRDNWTCGECPTQQLLRYRRTVSTDGQTELRVGVELQFFYYGAF